MKIEFATLIKDYKFSNISHKMLFALKENMSSTLLFERVPAFRANISNELIDNQTHWSLI